MNKLYVLLIVMVVVLPLEVVGVNIWRAHRMKKLSEDYDTKKYMWEQHRKLKHEEAKLTLAREHEEKKHLATGRTVYDRIYNKQDQSIIELIKGLAEEAFPRSLSE